MLVARHEAQKQQTYFDWERSLVSGQWKNGYVRPLRHDLRPPEACLQIVECVLLAENGPHSNKACPAVPQLTL